MALLYNRHVIEKTEEWRSFTKIQKEHHVLQSILLKEHPMSISMLDSLWQTPFNPTKDKR
jgi:hypothetical protein